jgi:hypothetical protein
LETAGTVRNEFKLLDQTFLIRRKQSSAEGNRIKRKLEGVESMRLGFPILLFGPKIRGHVLLSGSCPLALSFFMGAKGAIEAFLGIQYAYSIL